MIFIFDWGHRTAKDIGPLAADDLPMKNLPQSEFLILVIETEWFRLFFIPLIPTGRRHFLRDPDTNDLKQISKKASERYKPLAVLNARASNGDIDEAAFEEARREFFETNA